MTILTKQFYHRERGMGNEDGYFLARDSESGSVFVRHKWSYRQGSSFESDFVDIDLAEFLSKRETPQDHLKRLLGSLATDEDKPW